MEMKGFDIKRQYYAMSSVDGASAEIQMYGDVVEAWPTDWWTGERLEGSYIAQDEFLRDLEAVKGCKDVTIRLNSYGGDAVVGILIHNRLRELAANGTKLTCIVDGVAMSAGSVIMCACDNVRVNPSSLVMIHKGWVFLYGGYNADDMRKIAESMESYDRAMVSIYNRKCSLSDTVISHMMSDETYMTGKEAVEKGFADEVIEDAEPLDIAASADGRSLFVRGRKMHLCPGMVLPESIPTVTPGAKAPAAIDYQPVVTGGEKGGNNSMTKEELRAQYPELVAEVEADARAAVDTNAAVNAAVQAEERRMQEIDEVSALFDDELVQEAKYGDRKCSAQELAYRAAQAAAKQGRKFLASLDADGAESGAEDVGAAPGKDDGEGGESEQDIEAQAKAAVKAFMDRKEGK